MESIKRHAIVADIRAIYCEFANKEHYQKSKNFGCALAQINKDVMATMSEETLVYFRKASKLINDFVFYDGHYLDVHAKLCDNMCWGMDQLMSMMTDDELASWHAAEMKVMELIEPEWYYDNMPAVDLDDGCPGVDNCDEPGDETRCEDCHLRKACPAGEDCDCCRSSLDCPDAH